MQRLLALVPLCFAATGCMTATDSAGPSAEGAHASLADAAGAPRGSASFVDTASGLEVRVTGEGLPAGPHGVHLHMAGRCDPPDFQSAGAHWNPGMKQHGRDNPQGAHAGDLPNLIAGADGRGTVRFTVPGASLSELLDADGAALVVHASADDYRTDPSGNSGGRIACGVVVRR
ncbi:superoxide dismutase family protein [Sphingomonas sp. MAH-20]|uniref:Superoxide dismutase [Cu-Zn] n=1 Tax=Sphingomonas horti TaxID=2682842 RepID=A0A6I4J0X5_9SPHN|nr:MULTISPECIES: superoxide dismutase family protein [Sphingomonas]MBA2920054.1 superoxide dismutase family protein [Sphingomonas sp. CGMCC 1.13658]MVO77934.1 superoxide dismutase family protein [Sphingomonas horti]